MAGGKRWSVRDRDGNQIYLSQERWQHMVGSDNHPEMVDFEGALRTTIRLDQRRQEPLNLRKYRYSLPFDDLSGDSNHVVAIVVFGFEVDAQRRTTPNNYVATAFFKHMRLKSGQ